MPAESRLIVVRIPKPCRYLLCLVLWAFLSTNCALAQESVIEQEDTGYECGIVDQQKTKIGLDEGVSGRCSNNDMAVTCTLNEQDGWRCIGVGNAVTGFSLQQVIGAACACKPNPFLNNELGTEE